MERLWPTIAVVERRHVLNTLRYCDGNRTRAAKLLDISIRGLRTKLGEYDRDGFIVPKPRTSARAARAPVPQPRLETPSHLS